jgi:hypothetical protein
VSVWEELPKTPRKSVGLWAETQALAETQTVAQKTRKVTRQAHTGERREKAGGSASYDAGARSKAGAQAANETTLTIDTEKETPDGARKPAQTTV